MKKIEEWKERNLKNYLENNYLNDDDISHIFDWLKSDDAKKYQRQLYKLSVPDAVKLSKKWTEKLIKKASDEESLEDVETIYVFEDGYKIKELMTKQAYEREGKLMGHCVGGYTVGRQTIVSLRDTENKPHCTIEISNGEIQQIQGKENKNVVKKYHKYIQEYLKLIKIKVTDKMLLKIGILVDEENNKHDLYNLPKEPLVFKRNLDLSELELEEIPNIICYGYLDLSDNLIKEIPKGFIQNGDLYLSNNLIEEIPKDFKHYRTLNLSYNKIKEIPKGFKQNGRLYLNNNKIKEIPKDFKQNGRLYLNNNKIKEIPEGFIHNGFLDLSNNKIEEIPVGFIQNGDLQLSGNLIKEIPKGFNLNGHLDLSDNYVKEIPVGFDKKFYIYISSSF